MTNPFQERVSPPSSDRVAGTSNSAAKSEERASDKALAIKQTSLQLLAQQKEQAKLAFLEELKELKDISNWGQLPIYLRTKMFMEKPFKVKREGMTIDTYLTGTQALGIVFEIDSLNRDAAPAHQLTPYGEDLWIDPENFKVNVTVAGQRKIAGRRGDCGIPEKKLVERPFPKNTPPEVKAGLPKWADKDMGVECTIPVGAKSVTRTAWLSGGWYRNTKNWREQTEHMLGVRAEGMCYEAITGVGISQAHGNEDVEPPKAVFSAPAVTEFVYKEAQTIEQGEK